MALGDALGNREAEAAAAGAAVARAVEAVERLEHALAVRGGNAGTVVGDATLRETVMSDIGTTLLGGGSL